MARAFQTEDTSNSLFLLIRTVGIRDLVLGGGALLASRSGSGAEFRRWIRLGMASDCLDCAAALVFARVEPKAGGIAAGVTLPVIAADIWALRE